LPNSNPGGTKTSSGQACGGACIEAGWLTVGVYRNRRDSSVSGAGCARGTRPWPGWAGRGRRCSNSNPGAVPLHGSSSGWPWVTGTRGMGPVAAPGKGPEPAREGRGRGGPGGPQAPSAAGWPVGSLVTCALPSV
jgi:hypothetical protein